MKSIYLTFYGVLLIGLGACSGPRVMDPGADVVGIGNDEDAFRKVKAVVEQNKAEQRSRSGEWPKATGNAALVEDALK